MRQGELGNCWFISSLAALAEFQGGRFVRMLFPNQSQLSPCGAYLVRLCLGGRWHDVIIDDRLPCIGGEGYYTQLAYCSTRRCQLWASLVEKAFAKVCGSYDRIEAGHSDDALTILTGWPCERTSFERKHFDRDIFWATLSTSSDAHFLMTCSTGEDRTACESVGLVPNHAYSLLDVFEVADKTGTLIRLLKVRNPHAKSKWRGDWSDTSALWTAELRRLVNNHVEVSGTSGVFFMSYDDFLLWFESCTICRIRGATWNDLRRPSLIPSHSVPLAAFTLQVSEKTECTLLAQPEERIRQGPVYSSSNLGAIACIGFVIIDVGAGPQRDSKPLTVAPFKCRSSVSEDCWLQPGKTYLLVPLSYHAGLSIPAVLSCKSNHEVQITERSISCAAARAAWATFARSGKRNRFHDGVLYTATSSGGAIVALAENKGRGHFSVDLSYKSDPDDCFIYSRGSGKTVDWIKPGYGQILQIALQDGTFKGSAGWSSEQGFEISMFVRHSTSHMPSLDDGDSNIHCPFKLGIG